MTKALNQADLDRALRDRFGLHAFRPGQREVIEQVLSGRDVLCVMPTGGGKSLCYQLPALLLEGVTLVVSPLIALMKDQVDALEERRIPAALINSTLDPADQLSRIRMIESGAYRIVYVAPERFRSQRFIEAMKRVKPSLMAVDEAHCISEWGHDFRTDYTRLGRARLELGNPPCIALTATATDLVRRDIANQLQLVDPALFVTGFDRPNLFYKVLKTKNDQAKLDRFESALADCPGPAVVYASSRAKSEMIAEYFETSLGRSTAVYHAGLTREDRKRAQERFMSGECEVVVATNAFGMGVDKSNIRSVFHFNIPGTLEAYYQEAGRAGRDGKPSQCVLFHSNSDHKIQEYFIENGYPDRSVVESIYEFLRRQQADPIELTQAEIKEALGIGLGEQAVGASLKILEGVGALERFRPWENKAIARINVEPDEPSLLSRVSSKSENQRRVLAELETLVNGRNGELVYFRPDELAQRAGVNRAAFNKAVKASPRNCQSTTFRLFEAALSGSSNRRPPPRSWASISKDSRLASKTNTTSSRRSSLSLAARIVEGNSYWVILATAPRFKRGCSACDNCGGSIDQAGLAASIVTPTVHSETGLETILKVLSGVARANGRIGRMLIVQMLLGSTAAKLQRLRLDKLTTYGILKGAGLSRDELSNLIEALERRGLVATREVDASRPIVELSPQGWDYLKAKPAGPLELIIDPALAEKLNGEAKLPHLEDPEVREDTDHLRATSSTSPDVRREVSGPENLRVAIADWRKSLAAVLKKPVQSILSDETLEELVLRRPASPFELSRLATLPPTTRERFGDEILRIVRSANDADWLDPTDGGSRPVSREQPTHPELEPPESVATETWTWRLLRLGFNCAEAAQIRNLSPDAIVEHAITLARQGCFADASAFLGQGSLRTQNASAEITEQSRAISTKLRTLLTLLEESRS